MRGLKIAGRKPKYWGDAYDRHLINQRKYSKHRSSNGRMLRLYNLTKAQYDALLIKQDHCCAICRDRLVVGKSTHIDHCHTWKIVRGILCHSCNTGLGQFKDDPITLLAAIAYLQRSYDEAAKCL